jgi:type IV pilus assembly protein PilN
MIRINLLPVREAEQAATQRQEITLGALIFVLTVVLIAFFHLLQGQRIRAASEELARHEASVQQLRAVTQEVRQLKRDKKELEEKLKVIANLHRKKAGPVYILDNLSASTPAQLWLTEFVDAGGAATLSGLAADNQTIAAFMRMLSGSAYFSNVDLVETSQIEQGQGVPPLMRFTVRAQLSYLGQTETETEAETETG